MSTNSSVTNWSKLVVFSFLALVTFPADTYDTYAQAPNVALQGSYASAVTDGVDVFSGKLEQILPLLSIKGRGEIGQGLYLPLRNTEWNVMLTGTSESSGKKYFYYKADQTNYANNYARAGYSTLGKLEVETKFPRTAYMETPSVTEVRFTLNNGSIIHFRDVSTNGQPYEAYSRGCTVTTYHLNPEPACSRGRTFRSIDGSNATFVADADVYDKVYMDLLGGFSSVQLQQNVSGTLYLGNGTRMRFEGNYNNVTSMTDRNGNLMKFDYVMELGYTTGFLKKITDSLNREITISYGDNTQSSYFDEIIYRGFLRTERRIRINYTGIENVMAPGETFGTGVFPGARTRCWYLSGDGTCDPPWQGGTGWIPTSIVVPSSIVLPNGKEYEFYYNHYLETARIKYPTGSYTDYAYSGTIGAGADGFTDPIYMGPGGEIYRRVSSVKNFDETGQLVNEKTFSNIPQWVPSSKTLIDNVTIDQNDGNGTPLTRSKRYFYGQVLLRHMYTFLPASYGKEFKTEIIDPTSQSVLRRTETTWAQRAPFPWCGAGIDAGVYGCFTEFPTETPAVDPRIIEVKSTLETGEVAKKAFDYDQYNNVTDSYEYDYGSGTPGPLLRRTHISYITGSGYTGGDA